MTFAPQTLVDLQDKLVKNLHTINLGIVGDATHIASGGYHIGATSLRRNGMSGDYSLQYPVDSRAEDDRACAIDIGGTPQQLMTLGNRIVHALEHYDPRVYGKVRAVNAAFDGQNIDRRYDCENPGTKADDNIQFSSDRNHLHLEIYRTLVSHSAVVDGIYAVMAGEPLTPAPLDPNDPDWSSKVTKAELEALITKISDSRADAHVAAAVFGGNASLHKLRPGLYPEADQGLTDRIRRVENNTKGAGA